MLYQVYHLDSISLLLIKFTHCFSNASAVFIPRSYASRVPIRRVQNNRLEINLSCQLKTDARSEVTRRDKNITMEN